MLRTDLRRQSPNQPQTRQTLLPDTSFQQPGYLADLISPYSQSSLLRPSTHQVSVSSAAQLGHCCSSYLCCCSETLELSSTELSKCSIRYYYYRKKRFRWRNVKRLQGHLTNVKNSDNTRVRRQVRTEYLSDEIVGRAVEVRDTSDEQFRLQLTSKRRQ